ncbi:MAG: hypothetical protein U0800_07210 [Isosphaeraceae bacterium]
MKILTFASLALINVFWPALTVGFWPALIVGLVLLALAPQWESCIFGLMDLMSCLALSIGGVLGLARALTG